MAIALLCFAVTVILMMAAVQFNNVNCQLAGIATFLGMWVFSTISNMYYENED